MQGGTRRPGILEARLGQDTGARVVVSIGVRKVFQQQSQVRLVSGGVERKSAIGSG